jgi:hypothetical protein
MALAELVHADWPTIKLMVASGRGLPTAAPDAVHFLTKPYGLAAMTATVAKLCHED